MSALFGSSPSVFSEPIKLQSSLSSGQQTSADALTSALTGGNVQQMVQALYPSYSGQVGAPVSDATTQSTAALQSLVPGLTTAQSQASNVQAQGQTSLTDLLSRTASSYQPYYNQNVYEPLLSSFGGSAMSDIQSATGGTGTSASGALAGGGAPTATAQSQTLGNMLTTLGQTQANLSYNTTEQNQKNIISALQTLQGVTGAPISSLSTALAGGVSGQTAQQNYLTALYNDYLQGNKSSSQFIQDLIGYLKVDTQTQSNQNVVQQSSSGILGSALGGVGSAALGSYLGSLFGGGSGAAAAGAAGGAAAGGVGAAAATGAIGAGAGGAAAGVGAGDLVGLAALVA